MKEWTSVQTVIQNDRNFTNENIVDPKSGSYKLMHGSTSVSLNRQMLELWHSSNKIRKIDVFLGSNFENYDFCYISKVKRPCFYKTSI